MSQAIWWTRLTFPALERLHTLKKDSSQIGMNARKAVKFLDRVTSDKGDFATAPVVIQGPEEQYATWAEVEEHYKDECGAEEKDVSTIETVDEVSKEDSAVKPIQSAGGALSQMLLSKLNFAKAPEPASPHSTPPTSPSSSEPQSSKTSPEVRPATMTVHDASPTPPALKPLINSVVWYTYEKKSNQGSGVLFLTNAADTANLVRSFGITPKNIHQLSTSVGMEDLEIQNREKFQQKHVTPPASTVPDAEPKTLFKYEDDESDDEVVVFKPRGRGARGTTPARGSPSSQNRNRHSFPKTSASTPTATGSAQKDKPQIPVEEIDPDSFDRGSFARGSVPLVNTSNYVNHVNHANHAPFNGLLRGSSSRGGYVPTGPMRGGFSRAGPSRGFDRGSVRGRGRLFVP